MINYFGERSSVLYSWTNVLKKFTVSFSEGSLKLGCAKIVVLQSSQNHLGRLTVVDGHPVLYALANCI